MCAALTPLDTITAIATPPGRGGVGIIRISGTNTKTIAQVILGKLPQPRLATFAAFLAEDQSVIDQGIALYFPAPHSFTGEDVLELQGHGGPVILDCLLKRILQMGARVARPGEFSERAFLNDKLDLAQAEAIADLIDAGSEQAARAAMRSLQGDFSQRINLLVDQLIHLRMYVEAAIDFAEEEIDFLSEGNITEKVAALLQEIHAIQTIAQQGALLREGMSIVIAGRPNAGKSSLLNALSGRNSAIVTDIPGTTRDVLRETIQIDGLPLHIIDTAGLRVSKNKVEQEGMRRALAEINKADRVLLIIDDVATQELDVDQLQTELFQQRLTSHRLTIIRNKIDLADEQPQQYQIADNIDVITLSAKTGAGINLLRSYLKNCLGFNSQQEGNFSARRRHLDALARAETALKTGHVQIKQHRAGELLAEDLRAAQHALGEITGAFSTEDLLGCIFAQFCIGK